MSDQNILFPADMSSIRAQEERSYDISNPTGGENLNGLKSLSPIGTPYSGFLFAIFQSE